ncbi:MAG: DNA polymerase III subunit delta' C-terminal domain-containing protein, partial [Chloroflexota bacterium]
ALNCAQPPQPGEACGACRICRQTEHMQQPDLAVVRSAEGGSSIKVEQVRELQRSLVLSPYEARYRVALLLNFEQATASAQNALLKTLEEAPEKVILLLTAASPEDLLPTIVSRCEVLRLRPLPVAALAQRLQSQRGLPAGQAQLFAHLAGGKPGAALRLLDDPAALDQRRAGLDSLFNALQGDRYQRFLIAEALAGKDKEKARAALRLWSSAWRDVLLLCGRADTALTHVDLRDTLAAIAAQVDFARAYACLEAIEQAQAGLDANLNLRLMLEVLLLDLPRLSGLRQPSL